MKINYDTLTAEQLEEYIEFVDDWLSVPSHLINEDLGKKFPSIRDLQRILWFENLYPKMVIKEDQTVFPNRIFYFIGDEWYMDLDSKTGVLCFSFKKIWNDFYKKYYPGCEIYDTGKVQRYMIKIMQNHSKNVKIIPNIIHSDQIYEQIEKKINHGSR